LNINEYSQKVEKASRFITALGDPPPRIAVIIGSGLGSLPDHVLVKREVPYSEIPGFSASTVAGHGSRLIYAEIEGRPAFLMAGRKHIYEGLSPQETFLPIRALARSGIRYLIVTNAAGGLNRYFHPGSLMLIKDHINLMFRNPLIGANAGEWGPRFPDMSNPYDASLRSLARDVALQEKISLNEGVYLALTGPTYETRAEVEFLAGIGADAVGMSTVPETILAVQMGLKVLGISFISNSHMIAGDAKTSHEEVLANARLVEEDFSRLIRGIVKRIV